MKFYAPSAKLSVRFGAYYFAEMTLARSLKTYSTFVPDFAEVDIYLNFFYLAHAFIFYYPTELFKSDLFPTNIIVAYSAFDLHS